MEPIADVVVKIDPRGNPVRVRDLATVTDSSDIQTNIVRTDGKRSVYLRVNKQPIANTVEVVDALRKAIPQMIGIPPGVQVGISFDQSLYIRQSIQNLLIPLTLTIAIALFTSFFVSRTVTPALCYRFLKPEQESHRAMPGWWVRFMDWSRHQVRRHGCAGTRTSARVGTPAPARADRSVVVLVFAVSCVGAHARHVSSSRDR